MAMARRSRIKSQIRHLIKEQTGDTKLYTKIIQRGHYRYETADRTLAWAAARGLRARGHCLFWAVPHHQTPAWVEELRGEALVATVEQHLNTTITHFAHTVEAWDVNNEMIHGQFFLDQSGDPDIRAKMFKGAHNLGSVH